MADWDQRRDERERYGRGPDDDRERRRNEPGRFRSGERDFGRGDQGFQRGYRRHGGSYEAGAGGDFGVQGREPYAGDRDRGDWERGRGRDEGSRYGREDYRSDQGGETGGRYGVGQGREPYGTDWGGEAYGQGFVGNEGRGFGPGRDYENERQVSGGSGGRGERGWWDRATDEVASWFGDDDAERRRQQDHRGRGPRGYKRSDDRIKEDVSDRLADDPWVDASEIEVSVSSGEVTLSGTIDSRETRRRAEDIVERVSGVSYVQNNLRVTGA
jgi:osmotically-inducible protein OsmY